VALALFLRGQTLWRLAALGGCFVLVGGALFTYSRQAYFLILLAVVVLLIRRSLVVAFVLGAALIALSGYLPESVFQRVDETTQGGGGQGTEQVDASTASRWELWSGGMKMLADHPLGVGLYRFPKEIGNYSMYKNFDAHNFYVLTLAECGPFGLITLLLLIRAIFVLAGFVRRNAPPDDSEAKALTVGFTVTSVCMALGGIYGSPTLNGAVMSPFWALCGLLERYVYLKQGNVGQTVIETRPLTFAERFPLAAHILPGKRA
jgi:O-antigen ligase